MHQSRLQSFLRFCSSKPGTFLYFPFHYFGQISDGSRISLRRGRKLPRGVPTYGFAKNSRKLHGIEIIWIRGGGVPRALRSANANEPKET